MARQRAGGLLNKFVLRALPVLPENGKWTKSGQCFDMLLAGLWICQVFAKLMRLAFESQNRGLALRPASMASDDHDAYFVEQMEWTYVAGQRHKLTSAFFNDSDTLPSLTASAIVEEGSRWLASGVLWNVGSMRDSRMTCHCVNMSRQVYPGF